MVTKAPKKVHAALLLFLQLVSKHLWVFSQKENFRKKAFPAWVFSARGFNNTPAGTGVRDHNPALYSRLLCHAADGKLQTQGEGPHVGLALG